MKVEAVIAQALDNVSLDYVEYKGSELDAKEVKRRQRTASMISHVARNGLIVFDNQSMRVCLLQRRQRCLFEVPAIADNESGTKAPIAVCILLDRKVSKDEEKDVIQEMEKIAHRTGRVLDLDCKEQLEKALMALVQKINKGFDLNTGNSLSRVPARVAVVGGIAVAGYAARKLYKKQVEKSPSHRYQKKIQQLREKMEKFFAYIQL